MQNLVVIVIIGFILFMAVRPLIKFKKQKGSVLNCYCCSTKNKGSKINIDKIREIIKK